jgi:hypothetical protein
MEPRIETTEIKLVGVQGIIRMDRSFVPDLEKLYQRLTDRLETIPDISAAHRTFGYWHFVDKETSLYFAGVQVDTLERFVWDHAYGLAAWSLGNTTWAIWPEPDGQEGSIVHGGVCWRWMETSEYTFDNRFIGDFEVYEWKAGQIGVQTRLDVHQIWIPVVRKEPVQ